jgi:hypothetical protein
MDAPYGYAPNGLPWRKKSMKKRIEIITDCCCEHDLHEQTNYPREGLTLQRFKAGDVLEVEKVWSNCYSKYYRCITPKGYADIDVSNAKEII